MNDIGDVNGVAEVGVSGQAQSMVGQLPTWAERVPMRVSLAPARDQHLMWADYASLRVNHSRNISELISFLDAVVFIINFIMTIVIFGVIVLAIVIAILVAVVVVVREINRLSFIALLVIGCYIFYSLLLQGH